ncbi:MULTISPECIES: cation:proton antiporter [Haloarcula]|jgi:multicomponent Na+:H+ antiporter subunit F|nr:MULTISPECIES: cation:proton antiporter [Haloarcula]AEM56372.1 putative monovalent cation/H+ antiporter subunit F [Haloarcula hispanica ATCC 33960]AHB65185.1 cation:proton antiporter [Haloarcula hispanica N601]AJF26328.1 cation:proton antiporter [Haloarcula sp. CBA1115]EMA20913.1 monovalent cation/H+ antiporter subunit F [Haloarcula amylolytica JCM 13557]EMA23225.1 monovalent cation/H+ antiporter subunit F [Haloarcula argentinensis DSM 12282]
MIEFEAALLAIASAFVLFAIVSLYRVFAGPTDHDRVIAVNVMGTNTVIAIALVSGALDKPLFLDIALVYALLNFLLSIAFSKFNVEHGGVL